MLVTILCIAAGVAVVVVGFVVGRMLGALPHIQD